MNRLLLTFTVMAALGTMAAAPQRAASQKVAPKEAARSVAAAPVKPYETYKVPELMKTAKGEPVTTVEQWEKVRRPELLETFLTYEYGKRPVERPDTLKFEVAEPDKVMMDGKAIRKRIRASWRGPLKSQSFVFTAFIPVTAKSKPAPGFILICNRDPKENIDPERVKKIDYWPAEEIVERGYAAIAFYNGDIAPDKSVDEYKEGVQTCWSAKRAPDSWGTLSAWAWGASRVLDWIESEPLLDAKHVGVVGHSRGGKTALIAGITDTRFAMACSNDSGCGGAKLNHMNNPGSETVGVITRAFRHWFCPNYMKMWPGKDYEIPFDQHQWIALMAPRAVAIASASKDAWAGPRGEQMSGILASPAWELYGKKGLVQNGFPKPNQAQQEGMISYHLREGKHNLTLHDWNRYLDFADRLGWRK